MADIPVRKSKAVLIVLTLTVALAIVATVLLANDRKHLNALLIHYGLMEAPPPTPAVDTRKRSRPVTSTIPLANTAANSMFSASGATPFARTILFPAPDMCQLFAQRGFKGEGWQQTPMAGDASAECTSEKIIAPATEGRSQASLFVVVRGTQHEDIKALRIKMIAPDTPGGESVRKEMDAILTSLIAATGWSDLNPLKERIGQLENDINMTDASLSVTFKREFTNTDAYNLIIRPLSTNPDVRQLQKPARPGPFNQ